jgi:hypothetical protein
LFTRRVEVAVSSVLISRWASQNWSCSLPPRTGWRSLFENGCRSSACRAGQWSPGHAGKGHLRRGNCAVTLEGPRRSCLDRLIVVAPLRQWSHDRAMHVATSPVDPATRASWRAFPQQESVSLEAPRPGDITGRCSGTGIRGAHFTRLRPPAELRR